MKKQLLIVGLCSALVLGGGIWLLSQESQEDPGSGSAGASESSGEVVMYYFWGDGCPICTQAKPFLKELENDYPELEIRRK